MQHLNNLWGICRQEIGRGNFANSFLCHFLNFPMTRELIWAWALPDTSKSSLCPHECFRAMGQSKSWANTFMLGLDQPSFNLLSWVWFWFCTLSSGPPLCWLFFEVSSGLVSRRAVGNRRITVKLVIIVFIFCTLFGITQPFYIATPGLFSYFLICGPVASE